MVKRVLRDPVIYFIMAVNIGLAYAYFVRLISMETILFTYYFQSVMLGISYFIQILTVQKFSVDNLKINGTQVNHTNGTKGCIGIFFLLHYGFFHLAYLIFLFVSFDFTVNKDYLFMTVIAFALGELASVVRHKIQFENEVPNIGTMMFTPYLRIIPMHLFIIAGGFFGYHNHGIFSIFIILKIISDALMHIIVNKTYMEKQKNTPRTIINI